jgi:hypothetical protein
LLTNIAVSHFIMRLLCVFVIGECKPHFCIDSYIQFKTNLSSLPCQ